MEQNELDYNLKKAIEDFTPILSKMMPVDGWHNPQQWANSNNFTVYYNGGVQKINYICTQINDDDSKIYKSNETDISYVFNKQGFRTKNFDFVNKSKTTILTAGCSNTFGQSMPEDLVWTNLLKNKIKNKNVDVYNLGVSGLDTARIISNCYTFIKKYGNPDYVLLLLPPIQRSLVVDKNKEVHTRQEPLFVRNMGDLSKEMFKKKSRLSVVLYNNLIHLINLETFCYINNIKLIWFSWDNNAQQIYDNCLFNNNISSKIFNDEMQNIVETHDMQNSELSFHKYWDFAEDNDHQGLKWHTAWSNIFYKHMEI